MTAGRALRERAEARAAGLPALLARAGRLAESVSPGGHGRARAGPGEEFWQYRPARAGDEARAIDHRRSAMGDARFVREREWRAAQSVTLWVDRGASMRFASAGAAEAKAGRARVLGLACAILLLRGGERVGLSCGGLPPRGGEAQAGRLAAMLAGDFPGEHEPPGHRGLVPRGRAVLVSDFMGDPGGARAALARAAGMEARGALLHVLDPAEEEFPFRGRAVLRSMGGAVEHETLEAAGLRDRYLARLAGRKAELRRLCGQAGWRYGTHRTDRPAREGLAWLWQALDGGRAGG